ASAHTSQQEALHAALGANRALLLKQLQSDSSLQQVGRLREEVKAAADWFCSETQDITWSFVQECLLLLLTLTRHLTNELKRFQEAQPSSSGRLRTPEMAPPLPPDVLSVSQQKTLSTALQFVVSLGLCPYLATGVGIPLGRRSAFGAVVEKLIQREASPPAGRRLLTTTRVLLQVSELATLATLVFTRHLGDVMAALCQLGYGPHHKDNRPLSSDECRSCKEALRNLLGKVYQPIVIKELLILQDISRLPPLFFLQSGPAGSSVGSSGSSRAALGSAPAWLRRLCGQLLSKRLMQPNGVQAVVRAILEGGAGGDSDWRKCDAVARILVACPQQSASADGYFRLVCPQVGFTLAAPVGRRQILDLLHFRDKLTAQQFQRVATRAALSMVQERRSFAQQYLLGPLLAPLHRCITASETSAALSSLRQLSGLREHKNDVAVEFYFTAGSDGGVRLDDEDEELYKKLSGEQWRLECLMQLLAQLKDSDLPGNFFLDLLQELTSWAAAADEEIDEKKVDVAAMTLLEVEQQLLGGSERQAEKLALLQVLAVMVECLQHDKLLRRTSQ
ncbi:hypothetical protein GOODEAATRI_026385, partial [Goodea atripinnis]